MNPHADAFVYRADGDDDLPPGVKWRPSIHMPRKVSRITLEITDVRLEKLHAIKNDDAVAEGIQRSLVKSDGTPAEGDEQWWRTGAEGLVTPRQSARLAFRDLWIQINGGPSWNENPWVWVLSFRPVDARFAESVPVVEHPILFSAPMVKAILEGRKTQTRRIYKPRLPQPYEYVEPNDDENGAAAWFMDDAARWRRRPCPYGQVGHRLWVRETWTYLFDGSGEEARP
jgi:hypothetical protein